MGFRVGLAGLTSSRLALKVQTIVFTQALFSEGERLKLEKSPLETLTVLKHLERIGNLISRLRGAEVRQAKQTEQKAKKTAMQEPFGGPPPAPAVNSLHSALNASADAESCHRLIQPKFAGNGATDPPRESKLPATSLLMGKVATKQAGTQTVDTAIMDVKESSEQNGMTEDTLQGKKDGWNLVQATDGAMNLEEDVAEQLDGQGKSENAEWDLCE
ncbi:MAG: hypothetical protein LQ349_007345 [Xanthoria aureola]|nr:MAG: hypothetical protein LQ349_007345 [Xanthoria aureola]